MAEAEPLPHTESALHSSVSNVVVRLVDTTDIIEEVQVGETDPQIFYVHREVLKRSSDYFVNALKPEWTHAGRKPIVLQDDNPAAFKAFMHWAYSGNVELIKGDTAMLAQAYVLGEKFLNREFQDTVIDALREALETSHSLPFDTVVDVIYNGTPADSPARRLLVDHGTIRIPPKKAKSLLKQGSEDFIEDFVNALLVLRDRTGPPLWQTNPSDYYLSHKNKARGLGTDEVEHLESEQ